MNIVSLSRRTDLPAHYGAWFARRLDAGYADYRNPFSGTIHRLSLAPEEVIAFAFWTRNALPFLPVLARLGSRGFRSFFLYTITGYGPPLEGGLPPTERAIEGLARVSDLLGPDCVRWRYDPIVISPSMDRSFHLSNFETILKRVEGKTAICHTSGLQFYRKTERRLAALEERTGERFVDPPDGEKISLALELKAMAAARGVALVSCCDPLLAGAEIPAAGCIDGALAARLRPDLAGKIPKGRPTRPGCLCAESRDIGAYNTCLGDCAYCYATASHATARAKHAGHDPDAERLG